MILTDDAASSSQAPSAEWPSDALANNHRLPDWYAWAYGYPQPGAPPNPAHAVLQNMLDSIPGAANRMMVVDCGFRAIPPRPRNRETLNYNRTAENSYEYLHSLAMRSRVNPRLRHDLLFFYNEFIAPSLQTAPAAFQIWAHELAYSHPYQQILSLNLAQTDQVRDLYADKYKAVNRYIGKHGCVAYLFLPQVSDAVPWASREQGIILFRGTAFSARAKYNPDQDDVADLPGSLSEPSGLRTDFDWVGIGYHAFSEFKPVLENWCDTATHFSTPHITFVGHSLGGALAMRSLAVYAIRHPERAAESRLYISSSPGIEPEMANAIEQLPRKNRWASWHVNDRIAHCGHHPTFIGLEFGGAHIDTALDTLPQSLSFRDKHGIPLASLVSAWGFRCSSEIKDKPTEAGSFNYFRRLLGSSAGWFFSY